MDRRDKEKKTNRNNDLDSNKKIDLYNQFKELGKQPKKHSRISPGYRKRIVKYYNPEEERVLKELKREHKKSFSRQDKKIYKVLSFLFYSVIAIVAIAFIIIFSIIIIRNTIK